MALHPEIEPLVAAVNAVDQGDPVDQTPATVRMGFEGLCALLGSGSDDVAVDELALGDLTARRYQPRGAVDAAARPVVIWFHGGGWVIGSLDSHDALCRELAARSGVVVVSVDYRLAPEHPFPAAHRDAAAAVEALFTDAADLGLDPGAVAVGGDSAGANMAIGVAAAAARGELPPVQLQVLVYPVVDLAHPEAHPSRRDNAEGYLLTDATMTWFADTYAPDPASRSSELLSPLLADDLSGRAPAVVVTAEYDPLRDEGDAYARRLAGAGVPTEHRCVDGAVHLFLQMVDTSPAKEQLELLAASIRSRLVR